MTTSAATAAAAPTTPTTTPRTTTAPVDLRQFRLTFIHLDLGIGGAEQLVLQLAHASKAAGCANLELWTTRCDANHCFASLRPGTGALHSSLRVYGKWIPAELWGKGRALCSTLRLWYLTLRWIVQNYAASSDGDNQIVVLDVLPTPLPLLTTLTAANVLFYCHFPDQLLTRSGNNTITTTRQVYRQWLNWMENSTMPFADTICVNSKFTQSVVQETFGSLQNRELPVLYPALDTSSLDSDATTRIQKNPNPKLRPIVSLNRYERKKNLDLLLQAAQWIRQENPNMDLPPIIIAGGYDIQNVENVEYRAELAQLVQEYNLQDYVTFQQSISDAQRQELLRTALCVVYTPSNEHFGIVPLEAMYCQTPVLAVNSGGPTESVIDGTTGFLRPPAASAFGQALQQWIQNPDLAVQMGQAGRQHVQRKFGFDPRLVQEWQGLLTKTVQQGRERRRQSFYRVSHSLVYIAEALVMLFLCLMVTYILQQVQVLGPEESLMSGIKRGFRNREEL